MNIKRKDSIYITYLVDIIRIVASNLVVRNDEFHLPSLEGDFRDAFQFDSDFMLDGVFQG